jgi:hypothetical protein
MQIIFNFGFWKILQNGDDHYNLWTTNSWTTTFVFFNRFSKKKLILEAQFYKLSIFTCLMIFIFKMAEIFKMAFFILFFQNIIYWISINKSCKQSFNKKTRWQINSRWCVILKICSLLYNFCSFEPIFKSEYILEMPWDDVWVLLGWCFKIATNPIWRHLVYIGPNVFFSLQPI